MMRRAGRILLEIAGVLAGGLLVLTALALWRLSTAPVAGNFIRPYLEQGINNAGLGFTVSMTEAKLDWHRFRPALDLRLHDVKVLGQGGAPVANFRDATLGISLSGLLQGRVVPTEFDIHQPEIAVIRDAADHYSLHTGSPDSGAGSAADPMDILQRLFGPPDDHDVLGGLRRLRLTDGRIVVDDQKLGVAWTAPSVNLDINRTSSMTTGRIDLSLALPERTARFVGDVVSLHADGTTRVSFDISDFDAAAVAPLAKALAPLSALALPVSGKAQAVVDRNFHLLSAEAELRGTGGRLVLPDYYTDPVAIHAAEIAAHFAASPARLTLDRFTVDFGDAQLQATGNAAFDGPAVTVDAEADVANIPLARFDALWPHGVAAGGRNWVTSNIPAGTIKSGKVHLVGTGRTDDAASFAPSSVDGAFDYNGLEVHYLGVLPPIRNIAGHATFDEHHMDLAIDSGSLEGIAVSQGALDITGLDQGNQAIDIGITLDGPLAPALTVLDTKPFGYAHKLGIDPKAVGGHLNARATFAFPLVNSLTFADVALGAKGKLDGVAVAGAISGRDVTDGVLTLSVDKKGMALAGDAKLSGVPVNLDWRESFLDSDRIHSRVGFKGVLDDPDRAALKLDSGNMLSLHGKIAVTGQVTIDRARNTNLDVTADLAGADFAIDVLGIHKPAAEAGSASASLVFAPNKDNDITLRRVPAIRVSSESAKLAGSAAFAADGTVQHAEFPQIADSLSDYALTVDVEPGNSQALAVSVKGTRFDASRLVQKTGDPAAPPSHSPRLDLSIALDHLSMGQGHELDAVGGTAVLSGSRLDRANLHATAGGPVIFTYEPAGDALVLHLTADNAGALLNGLAITGGVRDGKLGLDGKTAGGEGPRLFSGTLDMRDFRLVKAPVILGLVNAVSPTGFVDLLSGQGLSFDHLSSEIDYGDGRITFRDGRSAGAMGISFEGSVDLDRDKIALKGTVVPADTLNRILAAIPLLGDIVTGGDRGGLIGWTYSIAGTTQHPDVSVNPLSVLAPGFLRNLFFLGSPQSAPKPAQPEPPPAPAPPPKPP